MTAAFDDLPLRQRKFARTKLGFLDATLDAIRTRPLEEVTVRQLCDAVEVSEASFFNYFPKKQDILTYYVQLWSIEMAWHARARGANDDGLAAIEAIFAHTAGEVARHPEPMAEVIAGQARMTARPTFAEVTLAERLLRFPSLEGIESVRGEGLDELLPPLIARAIAQGQLPPNTDATGVLVALATIFLGAPVVVRRSGPGALGAAYHTQLQWLWAGLRAHGGTVLP
jgi:AcrR family transcriptional regulator